MNRIETDNFPLLPSDSVRAKNEETAALFVCELLCILFVRSHQIRRIERRHNDN